MLSLFQCHQLVHPEKMVNNSADPWLVLDFHGNGGGDSAALEVDVRHFIMLRGNLSSQIY